MRQEEALDGNCKASFRNNAQAELMYVGSPDTSAAIYGLTSKARSISSVLGEKEKCQFFVGTLNLREENEIHLIEVNDHFREPSVVNEVAIFNHPGEVWGIFPSPTQAELFFTSYASDTVPKATLWRIGGRKLVPQAHIPALEGQPNSILWSSDSNSIVVVDGHNLRQLSMRGDSLESIQSFSVESSQRLAVGRLSPLHDHIVAAAGETTIRAWDLRTNFKEAFRIEKAHLENVRDVDFNPNSSHYLASGGDDCLVKFWDVRKVQYPAKTLSGHTHWVWNVKYSPNHDELVVSSGSDCKVMLWNVVSISFRNTKRQVDGSGSDDDEIKLPDDGLVKIYEEHEDSVYGLAWTSSASSATWKFASLSYDGRVVVNYVPKEYSDLEKY